MNLLNFVKDTLNNGGASFNLLTGEYNPNNGYMVATEIHEMYLPKEEFNNEVLKGYIAKNLDALLSNKNLFLGSWIDERGMVCLDISERIEDRQEAVKLGIERNQKAIWDNVNGVGIDLRDFI